MRRSGARVEAFLFMVFYSGGVLTDHDGSACWRLAVRRDETNARALSGDAKVIPAEQVCVGWVSTLAEVQGMACPVSAERHA
jgi:hypothetical protein